MTTSPSTAGTFPAFVLGFLIKPETATVVLFPKLKKIAAGYLSGPGGKIDSSLQESAIDAILRELRQETRLEVSPRNLLHAGLLQTREDPTDYKTTIRICDIYLIYGWEGTPVPSHELGEPEEFNLQNVPYDRIMPSDHDWMRNLFSEKPVQGIAQGTHHGVHHDDEKKRVFPVFWSVSNSVASLPGFPQPPLRPYSEVHMLE